MKGWLVVLLVLALSAVATPRIAAQKSAPAEAVPKYDVTTESTFKGTVEEVRDHLCPVSGGMGSHVLLKLGEGKTIEVHLATTQFVKANDLVLNQGDVIEVTGAKVKFEGADSIFAREIRRGNDTFAFRDSKGKPVW
jgi:DNA/RNA endonuclease YhcR with UshA esterase domain